MRREAHRPILRQSKLLAVLALSPDKHCLAIGACGQAGNAAVVLKGLSVAGQGAVGARGTGEGTIMKFSASATGQHDDDEAAVIAFLLAA
jgi:hypothetical protein